MQRRASATGLIVDCRQQIALGPTHQHQTDTVWVSETTLAVRFDDGETKIPRRMTTIPIRNIKANRPQRAQHCLGPV